MCGAECIFASAKRIEELQFLHLANRPFFLLSGMRMLESRFARRLRRSNDASQRIGRMNMTVYA